MWVGSAMCLLAAAVRRRERGAWALIGLGLLLWSGGDLVWTLWLGNLENPPYPSVADGLYLGSYVAIYAGLLVLLRARLRPIRPAQWLDGAVGGLAAAAVVAAWSSRRWRESPRATPSTSPSTSPTRCATSCSSRSSSWPSA